MFEYSLFHRLPVWSQVEVLTKKGNLLARRKHKDYTISLYHLDNYFVEVWTKAGLRIATSFRNTTKTITIMEPYLENITVQDLLKKKE